MYSHFLNDNTIKAQNISLNIKETSHFPYDEAPFTAANGLHSFLFLSCHVIKKLQLQLLNRYKKDGMMG